jgi:hypothetical protein
MALRLFGLKHLGIGRVVSYRPYGSCVAIAKRSSVLATAVFNIPETCDLSIGSKRQFCIRPRQQGLVRILFGFRRRASAARGDALDLI